MAAAVREEENVSDKQQSRRKAEEADKVEVAPGVSIGSLRYSEPRLLERPKDSRSGADCAYRKV